MCLGIVTNLVKSSYFQMLFFKSLFVGSLYYISCKMGEGDVYICSVGLEHRVYLLIFCSI